MNDAQFACLDRDEVFDLIGTMKRLIGTADSTMQLQAYLASGRTEPGSGRPP